MRFLTYFRNRGNIAVILIIMFSLHSCEKEEFGNLILSSDKEINRLLWSQTTDEILYFGYPDNYGNSWPLYAADINTGSTRKVTDISSYYGNPIFQKDSKIYFFNDLDMSRVKLYSVDISGGTPELVKDSLISPLFSEKYIAYIRTESTDTSYNAITVLYDMETGSETVIGPDSNYSPISISPDGEWVIMGIMGDYYEPVLSLFCSSTDEFTKLKISSLSQIYSFYWIGHEPYTIQWTQSGCNLKNMITGNNSFTSEDLNTQCSISVSPGGQYVYYLEEEVPALASSIVGTHYFLHLYNTGNKTETVIDLERDRVYLKGITFSPGENRIAYIRDSDQIYIIDI